MNYHLRHEIVRYLNRRKNVVKYVLPGIVFIVFAFCASASTHQDQPQQMFEWEGIWKLMTLNSLPRLASKFRNPEAKELAKKTKERVDALHAIWGSNKDEIDKDYLIEMTLETKLLEDASFRMSEDEAYEVLKEIAADIEIKLKHCQDHPKKMGSAVSVKIITKGPSGDSTGWQVFHVLAGLKKFGNQPGIPLPKFSSPAEGKVTVGRHLIWAKKGDITTKEETYQIGFSKDDQLIEIPVK